MARTFKLTYTYGSHIIVIAGIALILTYGIQSNPVFVICATIVMFVILFLDLKDIALIELNELSLKLIYRPFYKSKHYEYYLQELEKVSVYYSFTKGHTTVIFVKLKDKDTTIEHVVAMSVFKAQELITVFRNLYVKVEELNQPMVPGKIISLP
ncbi:MAG: hypothetical protein IPO86_05415 [Saprospiraceae bacterium]|nr:hypothetical protein [Saprospiraceae bacterium]MBK9727539.1 hypothetical protein [Saprospiraceae bacterium]